MASNEHPELFVDAHGVERGFYVYTHADRKTGKVFYVGKGQTSRAWDHERRSDAWKNLVASLSDGYEITLIKTGLSEIEAFEEEAKAVEEFGGCASNGGSLVNWIPGGENPVSVTIGFPGFDPDSPFVKSSSAYADARQFKKLTRKEQEAVARSFWPRIQPVVQKLLDYREKQRDSGNAEESAAADAALSENWGFSTEISDILRRRITWQDFCLNMEGRIDSLRDNCESKDLGQVVLPLAKQMLTELDQWFSEIDLGNREEADAASHQAWVQAHGGDEKTAWKNAYEACTAALERLKADQAKPESQMPREGADGQA